MEGLCLWLNRTKTEISKTPIDKVIHAVIGNGACDVDSIVSSILHAYYRAQLEPLSSTNEEASQHIYVPVINIPRADFPLRAEARWLLEETKLPLENLIFIDELDLSSIPKLKIILTDHNKLSSDQSNLSQFVEEIIDHHDDEQLYLNQLKTKIIEPVGSCCTLVGEEILNYFSNNPNRSISSFIDASLAKLLVGVTLLDTNNFNPKAGRTTPKDEKVVTDLSAFIPDLDKDSLFKRLQHEKFNVSFLSCYDLLRKDYKDWIVDLANEKSIKLGISLVTQPAHQWEAKEKDLLNELSRYTKEKNLNLLLIMTAFEDETTKEFTRELIVFSEVENKDLWEKINKFLAENKDLEMKQLTLKTVESGSSANPLICLYAQGASAASRKVLHPLLMKEFFSCL